MTPTKQTPSECKHYVEMLGYCELRDSWSLACNLCPYEDEDCDCPDYEPKEKKIMETTDYCDYNLSLALKAAGFDYPCYFYFTKEDAPDDCVWQTTSEEAPVDYNRRVYAGCSMPLLSQAQKWLREKRHISIRVSYIAYHKVWFADWLNLDSGEFDDTDTTFDSYEEALADGISAALELIKKGE